MYSIWYWKKNQQNIDTDEEHMFSRNMCKHNLITSYSYINFIKQCPYANIMLYMVLCEMYTWRVGCCLQNVTTFSLSSAALCCGRSSRISWSLIASKKQSPLLGVAVLYSMHSEAILLKRMSWSFFEVFCDSHIFVNLWYVSGLLHVLPVDEM